MPQTGGFSLDAQLLSGQTRRFCFVFLTFPKKPEIPSSISDAIYCRFLTTDAGCTLEPDVRVKYWNRCGILAMMMVQHKRIMTAAATVSVVADGLQIGL